MEGSYNGKGLACLCADTVLRLGLGAMFLYSAWGKISRTEKTGAAVLN